MSAELPPLLVPPELLDNLLGIDLRTYQDRERRVALRAAIGTSAGLCDALAKEIEAQNQYHGRIPKNVQQIAAAFRRAGDELWRMRDRVTLP